MKLRRNSRRYPDLRSDHPYRVIGIEADDLRILNDQGRPYLYPARRFDMIDPRQPSAWVTEIGDDGERYAYPPPLAATGFFEDYFDGDEEAVATFWRVVNERLASTATAV